MTGDITPTGGGGSRVPDRRTLVVSTLIAFAVAFIAAFSAATR